jgi:hypothetical protein
VGVAAGNQPARRGKAAFGQKLMDDPVVPHVKEILDPCYFSANFLALTPPSASLAVGAGDGMVQQHDASGQGPATCLTCSKSIWPAP